MTEKAKHRLPRKLWGWLRSKAAPALWRHPFLATATIASLLVGLYWTVIASDLYVSEAHIIIQRTDTTATPTVDFSTLLGGGGGSRVDQLFLRDHMLSVDMLKVLDQRLDLRSHYADPRHDILSRLWSRQASTERFHRYFMSRVNVEFDEIDGILTVRAQGYDPATAHALTSRMLQEGGEFMNQMARSLAQQQVDFLEKQVARLHERSSQARAALVSFQNREGMASPAATAESIAAIVARLEAQRADIEMQRSSSLAYLVADHPDIIQLNQKIAAIARQIADEQAKLASPRGKPLNSSIEEFQRLESEATFTQDLYKSALTALEKGRIDATRSVKMVSVLQAPTRPEYPLEPRRLYNTLVFALLAFMTAGIMHLLAAIVRDHKD